MVTAFFGGRFFILNEKMKQKTKYIFQAILVIIAVFLVVLVTRSCSKPKTIEHTVTVTDTVTNIEVDTFYLMEIRTEKLHTTDTLYVYRDSIYEIVDSVNVEVPISTYVVDKVFENDSSDLKIHLSLSGYNVKIDTLAYSLQYRFTTIKQPKKRNRLGFMVGHFIGVGYDPWSGKVVPAVGIGIGVGVTFKKW